MQQQEGKKQFSLTLILRVFLVLIVVVSVVVFANSVMKYNELVEKEEKLEQLVGDLCVLREELNITKEAVKRLSDTIEDYEEYKSLMEQEGVLASQIQEKKQEIQELLNDPDISEYIKQTAREKLGLYFPDEEIFFTK